MTHNAFAESVTAFVGWAHIDCIRMRKRIPIISIALVFAAIVAGILIAPEVQRADRAEAEAAEKLIESGRTDEGLVEMRRLAADGNTDAMVFLGGAHFFGRHGLAEDKELGYEWHLKAAEAGDRLGQYMTGRLLAAGSGVSKNEETAVMWWRKAADAGFPPAQLDLGAAYRRGMGGLEENKEEAVKWVSRAAEKGHADAQVELGIYYYGGDGVPEDKTKAEYWMREAAEQGNDKGMQLLGFDKLVENDYDEAFKWLTKSAAKGNRESEYWLATLYEGGRGVERDMEKAVALYESAAEKGYERAQTRIAEIRGRSAAPLRKRNWFSQ